VENDVQNKDYHKTMREGRKRLNRSRGSQLSKQLEETGNSKQEGTGRMKGTGAFIGTVTREKKLKAREGKTLQQSKEVQSGSKKKWGTTCGGMREGKRRNR